MASPRATLVRPCQTELCREVGVPTGGWGWGARGSGPWMHPAPSKATQPPLASNLPGFWQILLHQILRTEALLPDRVNSKTL